MAAEAVMERKWESIPEIRDRTGLTHDQVVACIREGMARKTCQCLPDIGPYGSVPLFFFGSKSEMPAVRK